MTTTQVYDLVKGEFTPENARDIINSFFTQKINYNKNKNLGHYINTSKDDPQILERIEELRQSQSEILALIAEAKKTGTNLQINSTISIELI